MIELGGLTESAAPRMLAGRLLLTYDFGPGRHDGRVHAVGAAFAHENWSVIHAFSRNQNDIYVLLVDPPDGAVALEYRLIVNGIWTVDPENPDQVADRWGVRLSRAALPSVERTVTESPIVHADGTVEFIVTAPPGSRVSVAGTFNGWDPFVAPLTEVRPGYFWRRTRLGPGEHLYYFMVDGLRLPDPLNRIRKWDLDGAVVSVVRTPRSP